LVKRKGGAGWVCEVVNGAFKFLFIFMNNIYFLLVCKSAHRSTSQRDTSRDTPVDRAYLCAV
jgi:hypothetical protein